jgi:hypothetical protein
MQRANSRGNSHEKRALCSLSLFTCHLLSGMLHYNLFGEMFSQTPLGAPMYPPCQEIKIKIMKRSRRRLFVVARTVRAVQRITIVSGSWTRLSI